MKDFSPLVAALEGFRTVRRHPRAVAIWAALNVLTILLIALSKCPQDFVFELLFWGRRTDCIAACRGSRHSARATCHDHAFDAKSRSRIHGSNHGPGVHNSCVEILYWALRSISAS